MIRPHLVNLFIYLGLLMAAMAEFGLAKMATPPFTLLTVAVMMSVLVSVGYMKLLHAPPIARVFVIGGVFWLTILLGLTMVDPLTRVIYTAPS